MSDKVKIRVLIVDDHAMVRSGLKNFLYAYEWLKLVGEAENGVEALDFCTENEVDVVLMDMVMPVMDGCQATKRIMTLPNPPKVIILTSFHEQDLVEQALKVGATSYLLKNVSAEELSAAIRSAAAGKATLSPEATEALIESTRHRSELGHDLTSREKQVLQLLVAGLSNQEMGEQLSLSLATVKFHLNNIFAKLDARNRVEATTIALEHNLVDWKNTNYKPPAI